jgi:hypothetical protein
MLCSTLRNIIGTGRNDNTDSNVESDSSSNSNSPARVNDPLSESRTEQSCDLEIL